MLVDASNQFYTLVPAMHPNPINDEGRLKEKVGQSFGPLRTEQENCLNTFKLQRCFCKLSRSGWQERVAPFERKPVIQARVGNLKPRLDALVLLTCWDVSERLFLFENLTITFCKGHYFLNRSVGPERTFCWHSTFGCTPAHIRYFYLSWDPHSRGDALCNVGIASLLCLFFSVRRRSGC